ncbi:MAG: NUDIX hydrolase [Pseudomonadota bacterium]
MGEETSRLRQGVSDDVPIRDAATLILVRDMESAPSILMGQRGKTAAFMADKFVFPGGAVDQGDAHPVLSLAPICHERLQHASARAADALVAAALRELLEETGQRLDGKTAALSFFFRAITPPGRPRRFDARFFLASADGLSTDPDRFDPEDAELSHLQWVPLPKVRQLNLPFITRIVLAELEAHLPRLDPPDRLAFIQNDDRERGVVWL